MNPIDRLYADETEIVMVEVGGSAVAGVPESPVVLAGSFNPLHKGHRGLLEAAEDMTGRVGWFEISIENVDKPRLAESDLKRRLVQFRGYRGVLVTRAPRFLEKARLIQRAVFAIGFDTAVRLIDDRYYGGPTPAAGEPRWATVLREIASLGCSFVVAGRALGDGRFRNMAELSIPAEFQPMFRSIPESLFREDISSTELRNRSKRPG